MFGKSVPAFIVKHREYISAQMIFTVMGIGCQKRMRIK